MDRFRRGYSWVDRADTWTAEFQGSQNTSSAQTIALHQFGTLDEELSDISDQILGTARQRSTLLAVSLRYIRHIGHAGILRKVLSEMSSHRKAGFIRKLAN